MDLFGTMVDQTLNLFMQIEHSWDLNHTCNLFIEATDFFIYFLLHQLFTLSSLLLLLDRYCCHEYIPDLIRQMRNHPDMLCLETQQETGDGNIRHMLHIPHQHQIKRFRIAVLWKTNAVRDAILSWEFRTYSS